MMSSTNEDPDHIKTTIQMALAVEKGTLIDFETTGIPGRSPTHEIVTLGYFKGNTMTIVQRTSTDPAPFYEELRTLFSSLPRPLYSYNSSFEQKIMQCELGLTLSEDEFVDIMQPWKAKAEEWDLKWPSLDDLISEPEDYFQVDKVSGKDVPRYWNMYLQTSEVSYLKPIMEYCLSDILRETMLMLRYKP